ncbi:MULTISPECIES: M15 family metallopeptidase [unclassified Empedobacter]|uniref:M15 family metallopeptidase n=1 Tax=unclassified Empedobacter TaxID=2643773 RepID=UPI0025C1DF0F|nr:MULTISPECIES: M15 family metallopeptidase [unclassified Empedobacter]
MYYDQISLDRIATFHPLLRAKLKEWYLEANNKLLPKGYRLRITHVYRSVQEQNDLYAQGRTKKGSIITNAKGGQSIHNYGLAFDFVILRDLDDNGTFETADFTVNEYWKRVANYFKSKGFTWGGDFKSFKDAPHLEYSKGLSWSYFKGLKNQLYNGLSYPILPSNF